VFTVVASNDGHVMLLLSLPVCTVGDCGGAHVAGDNNCGTRVPLHVLAATETGACVETPPAAQSGPVQHHR
jgi:hypothetical protein